jgi:prolyl oligopeptidase
MMMRNTSIITLLIFLYSPLCGQLLLTPPPAPDEGRIVYPKSRQEPVTDMYFGVPVEDPFQWLEDDRSEETMQWVDMQNETTERYLSKIKNRAEIRSRLAELWKYARKSAPFRMGKYYFFYTNDGVQNQSVLNMMTSADGKPVVFLDPNTFSADGTSSLSAAAMSKDSRYFSYGISKAGSDWSEFYIRDMKTNKLLNDTLKWVKFSGMAWAGDGFYYSRYDAPSPGDELKKKNEFHKVYFHKAGTPQSEDKLIFEDTKNPQRNFSAGVTYDEKFLYISSSTSTSGNDLRVKNLKKQGSTFVTLYDNFDFNRTVIDNEENDLLILTNEDAPNQKLIRISTEAGNRKAEDVIPQNRYDVLQSVTVAGKFLVARYLSNVSNLLIIYDRKGVALDTIFPPVLASIEGVTGHPEENAFYYTVTSFTYPSVIFKYDLNTRERSEYFRPDIKFDFDNYVTEQIWYKSKDGVSVPMFIVHQKDLVKDGKNPVFLYGYGGFNISLTPNFAVWRLVLLEQGFVFAMPNIRGGGEFGKEWHEAGMRLKKQNVFDDFISAAEYLIFTGYTNREKIAIHGRSNGGLLVGACMTQRPDLFKVAIPSVGVLDMLRYHKFTIGWAWAKDYGTSDNAEDFKNLLSYSPYHKITLGIPYPATLITTADHDDRVVPAHSFKFAAMLQTVGGGKNPYLIRIDKSAGHGAGKPTSKQIDEWADIISFTLHNMEMVQSGK